MWIFQQMLLNNTYIYSLFNDLLNDSNYTYVIVSNNIMFTNNELRLRKPNGHYPIRQEGLRKTISQDRR
jgi:hypothetical protein